MERVLFFVRLIGMHKKSCTKLFPRFIDPSSDLGFKSLLLNPANKPILLAVLNAILEHLGETAIIDLDYLPTEHLGLDAEHKKVVQDLECEAVDGRHFIVEMQRAMESDFRDRMGFYAFRSAIENVKTGESYQLNKAYIVVIMENILRPLDPNFLQVATLRFENSSERFVDNPVLAFIETPKVASTITASQSRLEWWICCLAHMAEWNEIPALLSTDSEFCNLFRAAELANFSITEQKLYFKQLDSGRNMKYALEYQWQKGIDEGLSLGIEQGVSKGLAQGLTQGIEQAKLHDIEQMLAKGCDWKFIQDITNIKSADFETLQTKYRK